MKTILKSFFVILLIPATLFSSTIYLRDGQVISNIENLREFEYVFLYEVNSRSISVSKDRIQRVVDDQGKILYELKVLTLKETSTQGNTVNFELFVNNEAVAKGQWYDEGKFRIVEGTIPDGVYLEYYPSGRIKKEYKFEKNTLNGICREYYASGIIERESNIVNGLENGISKNFHQNGKLKGKSTFVNGQKEGITTLYYESGSRRSEMNFVNGVPEGTQRVYYETGELDTEIEFSGGVRNGAIKQYYETGSPKMTGTFKNGKLEGEVVVYYESGRVKSRQLFRDGRIIER
jgi:antitoxin component YwqK of YwqJK toxin-antitoxin module